jgi:hypothetical protein
VWLRTRRWQNCSMSVIAALFLAGCGGGGGGEHFYLTINSDFVTDQAQASLSGTTSLPQGSERLGGTATMPIVTCSLGTYSLTWRKQDSNATGDAFELWNCGEDFARWSAFRVPVDVGMNRITVTFRDSSRTAEAVVTVTRR